MLRVVAIADSDSYLKWSAATLAAMPADWQTEQWVIRSPIAPSSAQVRAATPRPVQSLPLAEIMIKLFRDPPDVLLLAATGPVVHAVLSYPFLRRQRRRPVLITGLPGISIPASELALRYRSGCDLFLLHSVREVEEFRAAADRIGVQIDFGLATLPFIRQARDEFAAAHPGQRGPGQQNGEERSLAPAGSERGTIVFAAQAKVPVERVDREQVLRSLAALPPRHRVVIKLRATTGEQQTHRERLPYPELWQDLAASDGLDPERIRFVGGSMADALADADGFVTVSSTAALEAIGVEVPILILSDFGVSAEAINEVFVGSGCLGTLDDLAAGRLHRPNADWLRSNYFHPQGRTDWVDKIENLAWSRERGGLEPRDSPAVGSRSRWLRRQLRLVLPRRALRVTGAVLRRVKRVRRRLRGQRPVPSVDAAPQEGLDRVSPEQPAPGHTPPGPLRSHRER